MVERRLGRGLDFFLTEKAVPVAAEASGVPATPATAPTEGLAQVEINKLTPNPDQPRRDFHEQEILELGASIRASGMLQPIVARLVLPQRGAAGGEPQYQIIAGERRWRAAKSIGLERVPVLIKEASDEQVAVFALVENLHREDLNAVEKARAFRKIQEVAKCSAEEVGRQVGLDRSTVTNFLRLLELPAEVLAHVSRGTLSMGHARALLGVADSKTQKEVADQIVRGKLSVRDVETLVSEIKEGVAPPETDAAGKPVRRKPAKEAWIKECEDRVADALSAKVQVRYGRRKSKIVIECGDREDFERLYQRLLGED